MLRLSRISVVVSFLLVWAGLPAFLAPQQAEAEASAVPEAVAVRVWDGGRFVSDLGLEDVELTEDGVPQTVESLYLINRNAVERREGGRDFQPNVSRKYYFMFQLFDYNPKLAEAVRHFFETVIQPGDSVELQTPMHLYRLSPEALAKASREALAQDMVDKVRKDIAIGNSLYRNLLGELKRIVRSLEGTQSMAQIGEEGGDEAEGFTLELLLPMYRDSLVKLEGLRAVDEKKLLAFARSVRSQPGQKFVFYVYQREYRPEISARFLSNTLSANQEKQNVLADMQELFEFYKRNVSLDPARVRQAFADSGIVFNFLFMNKQPESYSGIVMREQSEDVFRTLSQVAVNSGGVVDNSQNPAASLVKALDGSESYYLLYYLPSSPAGAEAFKKLEVKVKGKDYQVVSRQGRF